MDGCSRAAGLLSSVEISASSFAAIPSLNASSFAEPAVSSPVSLIYAKWNEYGVHVAYQRGACCACNMNKMKTLASDGRVPLQSFTSYAPDIVLGFDMKITNQKVRKRETAHEKQNTWNAMHS
jgi:hypothetical protein